MHILLYLKEKLLHKGILLGNALNVGDHFHHLSCGVCIDASTSTMYLIRSMMGDFRSEDIFFKDLS